MKYLVMLVLCTTLQGCPLEKANPSCQDIVECSTDEETFCERNDIGGRDCYHNYSEYCVEKNICDKEKS